MYSKSKTEQEVETNRKLLEPFLCGQTRTIKQGSWNKFYFEKWDLLPTTQCILLNFALSQQWALFGRGRQSALQTYERVAVASKTQGRCTTSLPSWCKFCSFHIYFFGIRMGCCSATAALGLANKWLSPLICTSVYVCIPHICVIISFIFYCKSASSIFFRFCYFLIYITLIYTNIFLTVNFVLFPFRKIWFFIIYVSSRSPSVSVSVFVVSNKFCCCFFTCLPFLVLLVFLLLATFSVCCVAWPLLAALHPSPSEEGFTSTATITSIHKELNKRNERKR